MKKLSVHKPSARKYADFGNYLAGLIDGHGHFDSEFGLVISFNSEDGRDAKTLRSKIGFGKVVPIKNKRSLKLVIRKEAGLVIVGALVLNKLKHPSRIAEFNSRLYPKYSKTRTSESSLIAWDSSWFAGFFDAHGYFSIRLIRRSAKALPELRLNAKLFESEASKVLIRQFRVFFKGGYISSRIHSDGGAQSFAYETMSYGRMFTLIFYLDRYSLQSHRKYRQYTTLRKAYLLVQQGKHLTPKGKDKLISLKSSLK